MTEKVEIGTVRFFKNKGRYFIKMGNSNWIPYAVYIAKQNPTICGEWFDGCEVHHKDFNKLNDTPENLICLTAKEHKKIHTQNDKRFNAKKMDIFQNGQYLCTVNSKSEAARLCKVPTSYITQVLNGLLPNGKSSYHNYTFKYAS